MKNRFLLLFVILFYSYSNSIAQGSGNATTTSAPIVTTTQPATISSVVSSNVKPETTANAENQIDEREAISKCFNCGNKLQFSQWVILFSPLIIYLIFLICLRIILAKGGFRLADAITENFTVNVTRTNTDPATRDANPTETVKEFPKSASRLILFMSGFTAITVAVCLTTFYIYVYFRTGYAPNLDNFTNVLLSFGIGVIPYAFNKVSTALTLKP